MAQTASIPANTQNAAPSGQIGIFLIAAKSGTWIVRDAADRKGGLFATAKAARRFIKREFGTSAIIIETAGHSNLPVIALAA